jgi:hypothetical protein
MKSMGMALLVVNNKDSSSRVRFNYRHCLYRFHAFVESYQTA